MHREKGARSGEGDLTEINGFAITVVPYSLDKVDNQLDTETPSAYTHLIAGLLLL